MLALIAINHARLS